LPFDFEFTVTGSPSNVARTIEAYAEDQRSVNAIVVPWESDATTLSMSVTSVKIDGWAIEHTNLGTIRLTGLQDDQTLVRFAPDEPDHPDRQQLLALFNRFAQQVRGRFTAAS
jgi:hypothetical protein